MQIKAECKQMYPLRLLTYKRIHLSNDKYLIEFL